MYLESFPGCCTAKVLCDLGGSSTSEYDEEAVDTEQLKVEFDRIVKDSEVLLGEDEYNDFPLSRGTGLIVATTTTEQEEANEFLKSEGFLCAGPYVKRAHPETGLYLWWYVISDIFGEEG